MSKKSAVAKADPKPAPAIQFAIESHVFGVEDAASHLRVSRSYIYELIAAGKLKTFTLGKRRMVKGAELARFIKSL